MFCIKDFFSKCDQIRSFLVMFTEEILNGKHQFLCSVVWAFGGKAQASVEFM